MRSKDPIIEWSDAKFSVNVAEIDAQHKKLIAMINDIHETMKNKSAHGENLKKILHGLEDYINRHFTTEENYFTVFKYPDAAAHIREHQAFSKKVAEFKGSLNYDLLFAPDIYYFLKDWLIHHICVTDRAYGPWFNQNGLK